MDRESLMNLIVKDEVKTKLTISQKEEIIEVTKYPFAGIPDVIALINKNLKKISMEEMEDIEIYPSFFPVFKLYIQQTFLRKLEDPGAPVGPRTSDAVGQQATQALLNTFHQAGSSKSGGPDGIRENISISKKRKAPYSFISFWNDYYTLEEVMNLKTVFTGITIEDLAESILPINIDFSKHYMEDFPDDFTKEYTDNLLKNKIWWWYVFSNINSIYTDVPRTAIRIKLDIMKLYEYKITTTMISEIINNREFSLIKPKSEGGGKDSKDKFGIFCIPSPTYDGIIDLFLYSEEGANEKDVKKDYFLTSVIPELKEIVISGISGIRMFYPISKPTINLIRHIKEDDEGTRIYLKDIRFSCIPVTKLIKLLNFAGLDIDIKSIYEESHLEFHSHKINKETRTKIKVTAISIDKEYDGDFIFGVIENNDYIEYKSENRFISIEDQKMIDEELKFLILNKKPTSHNIINKKDIELEDYNEVIMFIDECNNGNEEIITSFLPGINSLEDLINSENNFNCYRIKTLEGKYYYIAFCRYKIIEYTINVNIDFFNSSINCTSLENYINSTFSENEFSLDNSFRLPKIETLKLNEEEIDYLHVKTKIFFRNDIDNQNEKENSPMERFEQLIRENVKDERLLKHVYAETTGSSLDELISHKLVDPRRTYCNDFYSTLDIYGIEGLYNLLTYELIEIVNKEGYINVEYPALVSATTTANGVNPMTSQGITSQKRSVLSQITFDNATKYLTEKTREGVFEKMNNISASIFVGSISKIGTGYTDVRLNETEVTRLVLQKEYEGVALEEQDDGLDPHYIEGITLLYVKPDKFPKVDWVYDNFISNDIMFFIEIGIKKLIKIPLYNYKNPNTKKHITNMLPLYSKILPKRKLIELFA